MANNYTQGSGWVDVPDDKLEKAKEIIKAFEEEFESDEEWGYLPLSAEVEPNGVWIYGDESIDPEITCELVEKLVKELELTDPVVMEFAFTCSKPCIDGFGGCGFRVELGKDTKWVYTSSLR